MTPLVPLAMFGWPLIVLLLFSVLPPRRAVIIGMLGAWLFLPMAGYSLPGLPDITKMSITCVTVCLGTMIFDAGRFSRLRLNWVDLAMLAWVIVPLVSLVVNGYGAYEGMSGVLAQFVAWGMPYLIGRIYFSDGESLRELAMGIFVGGLVYLPLVLFEARMSPQLHTWVYGFHQHDFGQSRKGDGWRPTVFMQHGLAVAMFMGTTALCGTWMWLVGKVRTVQVMGGAIPTWTLAIGLFAVAVACRSSYALLLLLAGTGAMLASRWLNTRLLLAGMMAIAPLYVAARTVGGWDAQPLRDVAGLMGQDREGSLSVRLDSEDVCWRFMQSSLLVGDGRMDRLMLRQADGERFVPDALWLITLTKDGLLGLAAMFVFLLTPPAVLLLRFPARALLGPQLAGATVLATVMILYTLDNLQNAMVNPIYLLGAGGIVGLAAAGDASAEWRRSILPTGLRGAAA